MKPQYTWKTIMQYEEPCQHFFSPSGEHLGYVVLSASENLFIARNRGRFYKQFLSQGSAMKALEKKCVSLWDRLFGYTIVRDT